MANAQLTPAVSAFTPAGSTQPLTSAPTLPTLQDTSATQSTGLSLLLPAAGTSVTLPVPAGWSAVKQVQVVNTDAAGYCVLKLNATSGPCDFLLAPQGGQFCASHGGAVPAGEVAPSVGTWTLRSCDSSGVVANGAATQVWVYLVGA